MKKTEVMGHISAMTEEETKRYYAYCDKHDLCLNEESLTGWWKEEEKTNGGSTMKDNKKQSDTYESKFKVHRVSARDLEKGEMFSLDLQEVEKSEHGFICDSCR